MKRLTQCFALGLLLISGTAVVIVACLITGIYLYANDRVWQWVVQHLLLR
jgi:hypothetical protein